MQQWNEEVNLMRDKEAIKNYDRRSYTHYIRYQSVT